MITWLAGVIYPDDLGEVGMLLHNGSKESYFWNPGDSLGHHLVLPCLRVNVNIATKKKKKDRTDLESEMEVWITLLGKEP